MTLKVFEAFAGVGSQRMALRNLDIPHEVVAISEIDKFAIKSYEAIHGPTNNVGDITKLTTDDIPDHDLFTYSFPCQDISVAGKQNGLDEDSDTRSSLLWHCRKIIEAKKPKYLLLENVKNLVSKRHKHNFDKWLDWLCSQGYTNYWQVLNAKDYGVPQNRERVFVVSVFGEHKPFEFPQPIALTKRLKDVLEDVVSDKYYLDNDKTSALIAQLDTTQSGNRQPKILEKVGNTNPSERGMNGEVYNSGGLSPKGEGPKILQKGRGFNRGGEHGISPSITTSSWHENNFIQLPVIAAIRGRNPENPSDRTPGNHVEQRLEINKKGISNTLTTVQKDNYAISTDYRIRKLTPLECWRLMGFSDEDFYKAQTACSNTQLYKQAGNSIVKDVLMAIFSQMFIKESDSK